jgi:hypothetical protein
MADVRALTADYEAWLGARIPLDPADLARKHEETAHDEYRFLRGTYYLWLVRVAAEIPQAFGHASVPLVGDLHVENYGTWRDRDQIRRWGVNDLDELARGPWLLDLVRLATSAVLAPHLTLGDHEVCDTVLTAWYDASPGPSVDLRDADAAHLAPLVPEFPDPGSFYAALARGPVCDDVPPAVAAAAARVAEPGWRPTWHAHEAGTGSLGHLRRVGVGQAADHTWHAREAKQTGPPTCVWAGAQRPGASMPSPDPTVYDVVSAAVRGPAGAARVEDWQVRDLAPDVVRIQLAGQSRKDSHRLVDAMARAAAGVHAADPQAFGRARSEPVSAHDFRDLVATMADVVRRDFHSQR